MKTITTAVIATAMNAPQAQPALNKGASGAEGTTIGSLTGSP